MIYIDGVELLEPTPPNDIDVTDHSVVKWLKADFFLGTKAKKYFCDKRKQMVFVIEVATKKGYVEAVDGDFVDLDYINSDTRRGRVKKAKGPTLTQKVQPHCIMLKGWFRRLSIKEYERLQGLPEGYTESITYNKAISAIGNGWQIDTIVEFFKPLNLMMKEPINVLSGFDGISCGQVALERANVPVANYYASEIDKHAIKVTQSNYPNTKQLGSITDIKFVDWRETWIDLIMGGSPCQGFSFAGKQLNFDDPRSRLFFEFVRLYQEIKAVNPKVKFFLENVRMKQESQDVLSKFLGVEPIVVNSNLVSAQNRYRLYWTNIEGFTMPEDKGILLKDILQDLPDCPIGVRVREKSKCLRVGGKNSPFGSKQEWDSPFQRISKDGSLKRGIDKPACLTGGGNSGGNHSDMDIIHSPFFTRRYSVIECERLQTLPDDYTASIPNTQRFRALGNAWTVNVPTEFFKHL